MTEVSVVTWNLHQAVDKRADNIAATWKYLANEVRPTVALVQEALPAFIPKAAGNAYWSAEDVPYVTAIVAYTGRLEPLPQVITRYSRSKSFSIRPTVPAAFAAARVVDLPDVEPFVAVSLYGRMAPLYAQTTILRAIADLIPLFDAREFNRRIVIGGDINAYDQSDEKVTRARWKAILQLFEALGLVNLLKQTQHDRGSNPDCPCRERDCWHVETFRHRNRASSRPGYMTTDYLFATRNLAAHLLALEVWHDRPSVWELSDHCPLVARFDL